MPMSIEPGDLNTSRLAAQTLPVFGGVGGAALNAIFMYHFQSMALAHLVVCRLERKYGEEFIRLPYAVFEKEDHASRSSR